MLVGGFFFFVVVVVVAKEIEIKIIFFSDKN